MQNKRVALVTGANQGIGLQIANDLVAHGFTVLVGSRNFERGEAAAKEAGRTVTRWENETIPW
jgi:NAD(P)-dependent dehydrogenase (short-subunit alcohol dehydrogenase family)